MEGQEKCGKLKALREQYPPAHLKFPQYREEMERKEVGEAPEGVKRANALRYKEYLGMAKKERQVIRKLIEGQPRRRSAPHHSSGGAAYKVGGVKIEKLLAANRELKAWQRNWSGPRQISLVP